MGSKHGASFDGTPRDNAISYSVNEAAPTVKSRKCEMGQHTASETSNLISVNSSHDSFSENAESKASLRTTDVSCASQDFEVSQKLLSGGSVREGLRTFKARKKGSDKSTVKNKFQDSRGLEGHDDNISCLSGATEATKLSNSGDGALVSEEYAKAVQSQTDLCVEKPDVEGSENKTLVDRCNDEHIQKVHPSVGLTANFSSPNSGGVENHVSKDNVGDDTGSDSVQSESSCPPNGKSISRNISLKNLEADLCSQLGGEAPECTNGYLNSSTSRLVGKPFSADKPASYASEGIIQEERNGFGGGNSDSEVQDSKIEAEIQNNACNLPVEASDSAKQAQELEKAKELHVLPETNETATRSHPVNESDESDIVEHDVSMKYELLFDQRYLFDMPTPCLGVCCLSSTFHCLMSIQYFFPLSISCFIFTYTYISCLIV